MLLQLRLTGQAGHRIGQGSMGQADVFGLGDGLPRLRRGLRVTHLGDERLVLDPASGVVHTVRGPAVRALDALLAGRRGPEVELVAALASAGIVEVPGTSRRSALLIAGSALGLIASTVLPAAIAAASTLGSSVTGDAGVLNTYTMSDGSLLYSLTHTSNQSTIINRNLIIGSSSKKVELLLVGGGGSGGDKGDSSTAIYGGGGGGGEVVFVTLASVDPSTNFRLTVAGRTSSGSGQDTIIAYEAGAEIARADGGGVGGGASVDAGVGGSGGGGSSARTGFGAPTGSGAGRYGSAGAAGASGTSGGGGGAGGTGVGGTSTTGGSGGAAKSLSDFFSLTVASGEPVVAGELNLGAGGGGAGVTTGGSPGAGGGAGGYLDGDGRAISGVSGSYGSGGGGGGSITPLDEPGADPGWGASGAIWVRVSNPT